MKTLFHVGAAAGLLTGLWGPMFGMPYEQATYFMVGGFFIRWWITQPGSAEARAT